MVNMWPSLGQLLGSRCPLCGIPCDTLCADCSLRLPLNGQACRRCAAPLAATPGTTLLCADCLRHPPAFDRVIAPLLYRPPVDRLIAAFKDRQQLATGRMLANVLAERMPRTDPMPALLVPVPADRIRLRQRGFNQAAELTRQLAGRFGIRWRHDVLRRSGVQGDQRALDRAARLRNVRGAFVCTGPIPAHVALIDDVVTTAATADAASRALRRSGARRIEVWAVARTPGRDS